MAPSSKPAWKRSLANLAVRSVVRLVLVPVRRLPLRQVQRLGGLLGSVSYRWFAFRRRRIADANLRAAFGAELTDSERQRIVRACLINTAKMLLELFKLPQLTPEAVKQLVKLSGGEHVRAAHAKGHGVIVLTGHFGNFELGAARLRAEGYAVNVVARDAPDTPTAQLINACRESHGTKVLAREEIRAALRCLQRGELLALVADQHQAEGGIIVDFFGRPAATATGPALFAARTGAPVVPVFVVRESDDTFNMIVEAPVALADTGDREADMVENTQRLTKALEAGIRRHPDQWFWMHRRWKAAETLNS